MWQAGPAPQREADVAALRAAPGAIRSALVVELAVRLCWYGRTKPFDAVLKSGLGRG